MKNESTGAQEARPQPTLTVDPTGFLHCSRCMLEDAPCKHWREFFARHAPAPQLAPQPDVKRMVERFLQWRLPENFNPDCGISFKKTFNENTPHPMTHEPTGTNLLDYTQAEEMVRYMLLEGVPPTPSQPKCAHVNMFGHEYESWCGDCGQRWPNNLHRRYTTVGALPDEAKAEAVPPSEEAPILHDDYGRLSEPSEVRLGNDKASSLSPKVREESPTTTVRQRAEKAWAAHRKGKLYPSTRKELIECLVSFGEAEARASAPPVETTDLNKIILEAIERCDPTTDGERYCLYGNFERFLREALAITDQYAAGYKACREADCKWLELNVVLGKVYADGLRALSPEGATPPRTHTNECWCGELHDPPKTDQFEAGFKAALEAALAACDYQQLHCEDRDSCHSDDIEAIRALSPDVGKGKQ